MLPFYMVSLADTLPDKLFTGLPSKQTGELAASQKNGLGWVGIAQLHELTTPDIYRLSGSAGCRVLLQKMLSALAIAGMLDDHHFPYRVISQNVSEVQTPYFVSFSHSLTSVAVLLAHQPNLGIDIEQRPISPAIAQRYFSPAELAWLASLPLERHSLARTLLWTLKEARIKSQTGTKLFSGIHHDILADIRVSDMQFLLTATTELSARSRLWDYDDSHKDNATTIINNELIGFDRVHQCGWWVNFSN